MRGARDGSCQDTARDWIPIVSNPREPVKDPITFHTLQYRLEVLMFTEGFY